MAAAAVTLTLPAHLKRQPTVRQAARFHPWLQLLQKISLVTFTMFKTVVFIALDRQVCTNAL